MNKLLSASLLALGAMATAPALAGNETGAHLYIQDLTAPVQITYGSSFAAHTTYLYIGTLDASGNYVDTWDLLLKSVGTSSDKAYLGSCFGCMTGGTYSFTPSAGAVEVVFFWSNETVNKSYYSSAVNKGRNPVDSSGNSWEKVTYSSGNKVTIGFEDGGGTSKIGGRLTDWDFNDVVISMTNIGPTQAVPEPETYAMLLAGLGMVGVVARRRRNVNR